MARNEKALAIPAELMERIQTLPPELLHKYILADYTAKSAFYKSQDRDSLYFVYDHEGGSSLLHLKFQKGELREILHHLIRRLEPSVSNTILESLMRIEEVLRNMDIGNGQNQHKEDS